jgi:AcrR family transcriptional regulator
MSHETVCIIMSMNVSSQEDPRKNQKNRTRAAIVDAALDLMREGVTPTVTSAAEAARVSRPTAYRYFPSQESLMSEIMDVTPTTEPVEELIRSMDGSDPKQRLDELLDVFNGIFVANEGQYRAALRVYLDTWFAARKSGQENPDVRFGRRTRWLESALESLHDSLQPDHWRRLINALSLTLGADSLVILKDVCRLENNEALDVLQWTAKTILDATLREAGTTATDTD